MNEHDATELAFKNGYEKAAKEIFTEIETCMKYFEDDDDGYILKKCEFEFFMRELKKKYESEENKNVLRK